MSVNQKDRPLELRSERPDPPKSNEKKVNFQNIVAENPDSNVSNLVPKSQEDLVPKTDQEASGKKLKKKSKMPFKPLKTKKTGAATTTHTKYMYSDTLSFKIKKLQGALQDLYCIETGKSYKLLSFVL